MIDDIGDDRFLMYSVKHEPPKTRTLTRGLGAESLLMVMVGALLRPKAWSRQESF